MRLKLWAKLFLCRLGFGASLIEFCGKCGTKVDQVWRAPDEMWLEGTGAREDVRCISCFDKTLEAQGKILRWVPHVAHIKIGDHWV